MDTEKFIETFKQHIEYRLEQSKIKITDLVLEELISFSLEDSKQEHLYESGSHQIGKDISISDLGISIKSAKDKNNKITISSFRLTRYKDNLDEMIDYIDNGTNYDFYFVLARDETDTVLKYTFYILPHDIFKALEMKWVKSKGGWNTVDNPLIKLKIVKSMSSQLWIELNKEYIEKYEKFTISKNKSLLGDKRFIAISK